MRSTLKLFRQAEIGIDFTVFLQLCSALNTFRVQKTAGRAVASAANVIPAKHFDVPTTYQSVYKLSIMDKPKLVIFDKDGTLICFHEMWIPWAMSTAQR